MSNTDLTSNEKLSEALRLLEEAAKEKKDELRNLASDKYCHLKEALAQTESTLEQSVAAAKKRAVEAAQRAKDLGVAKAKEIASDVDESVHRNPWPYIGGAAAVSLLAGYILGRKK
ncbi:MAG TPA: hypothetical protein VM141_04215 [Planctomycetota bacterium]|nr:hypothetical protein [Planctomycetota bacterium]